MLEGPKQFIKLPFSEPCYDICPHHNLPFVLHTSSRYLYNYNIQKDQQVKCITLEQEISDISGISYSRGNLLYYCPNFLYINNQKLHLHQGKITKAIADDFGIVLTSGVDQLVKITSVKRQEIVAQFKFHYYPITQMFWHNSLSITGDSSGQICLWDINKCQQIDHRRIHYESIDFLGVSVDYTINNIFYTANSSERRLVLSDLRTNKSIKIIADLQSSNIVDIKHNSSGKIFIVYQSFIDVVDIYKDFKTIGNFSPAMLSKQNQVKWTNHSLSIDNIRKFTSVEIIGKYLICGCSNGSIEVYDSDLLECIYGFGLTKFGPIQKLRSNTQRQLFGLDGEGEVYMAKF